MIKKDSISAKNTRAVRAEVRSYLKTMGKSARRVKEASPSMGSSEDLGWRPITANKVDRDLNAVTQDKMQNIAVWLYDSDPIAKRILDLKRDFLVGDGVVFKAEDEKVDEVLQAFWYDPVNNMDLFVPDIARDLGLFGEQALPVFVNKENGHVRLGYIDPCMIDTVVTNPDNCRELIGLVLKEAPSYLDELDTKEFALVNRWRSENGTETKAAAPKRDYTIINESRNADDAEKFGKLIGETFFFAINKVTNATRGRSDLLSLADWIHNYETFLFNRIERARLLNTFLWDVELQGMNADQIQKFLASQGAPRPGSVRAHNEKVKWQTVSPQLESNDASNEAAMFRSHIAGGAGIPVHWLGGGEGLTRATALEMSTPVFKHLKQRQLYLKYIVTQILDFVIDQAIIAGKLSADINRKFSVKFPPLSQKDLVSLSTTLQSISSALVLAKDSKLISPEEASKHFRFAVNLLGGDMDATPSEELEAEAEDINPSKSGDEPDEGVGLPDEQGVSEAIKSMRRVQRRIR